MPERARPALAAFWFVALATVLCWPIFRGRFFIWDVPDQYWADLRYLCASLHDGEWPLWNPYDRGGYPFHADPQSGLYYPLNWALCAVSGPRSGLIWTELRVPLHFALAGCAMTGFLRALSLPWGAAVLGGTTFVLAPFQRRMWEVNLTYTIAYAPALLWAIERIAQRPSWRPAGALALVAGTAASVGSPPALYFCALTAGAYAVARCARVRASWLPLLGAGGLAAAMSAVAVLPAADLSRASVQQAHDFASISAGAYPLRALPSLVWPDRLLLYVGAPALMLAFLGALSPRSPLGRTQRLCFGLLALFGLAMMFGADTPVYRVMYRVLPGVSAFRLPTRYSAVIGAAVAVLAAGGVAALPKPRASPWIALLIYLASVWPALPPERSTMPGPVPGSEARYSALRARVGDVENRWRVFDEFGLGLRAGTRYGMREFRGYQDPLTLGRFERIVGDLGEHPRMLEQYNVRYLLRGPHYIHGTSGHSFLPFGAEPAFAHLLGDGVWETERPLPTAFWVPRAEVLTDGDAVLARLRARAPEVVCLLEASDGPAHQDGVDAPAVEATSVHVGRNGIALDLTAPADGWLVVNESYYPGWSASVDGVDAPVRRANYLVRAVRVRAGHHHVTMAYRPRNYRALAALSALAALASLALLLLRRRDARRYSAAAQ